MSYSLYQHHKDPNRFYIVSDGFSLGYRGSFRIHIDDLIEISETDDFVFEYHPITHSRITDNKIIKVMDFELISDLKNIKNIHPEWFI